MRPNRTRMIPSCSIRTRGRRFPPFGAGFHVSSGTYVNRNHFAGLLEMGLPILLGMSLVAFGSGHDYRRRGVVRIITNNQALGLLLLTIVVLLALVFSRSRAGVALGMIGVLVSSVVFSRRIGGGGAAGWFGAISLIAVSLAAVIGLVPVLQRFAVGDDVAETRWTMYSGALDGILAMFPLGSGPGSFGEVFLQFQPTNLAQFVSHAHNGYLEWVFETGLAAVILIVLGLFLYLLSWRRFFREPKWGRLHAMQVGAGIGLLLLMLHELVDFNLRIPANALYFGFLAGVFFAPLARQRSGSGRRASAETPHSSEVGEMPPPITVIDAPNPFSDD